MPRKNALPASRRHLMIDDDVWEFYSKMYGPQGYRPGIGVSKAINVVLRAKMRQLNADMIAAEEQQSAAQRART